MIWFKPFFSDSHSHWEDSEEALSMALGDRKEGERQIEILKALCKKLGIGPKDSKQLLTAWVQIVNKGTVWEEDFRGHIGQFIPGALAIGAKVKNLSTANFIKLLKFKELSSNTFLANFAAELKDQYQL